MHEREIRALNFEIRAEENQEHGTHLVGMAIVYGQVIQYGWRREVIDAGAIDGKTDLKDVRFLIGHNLGMVPLAAYNYSSGNHGRMQDVVRLTRKTGILVALISIVLYETFFTHSS